MGNLLGQKNTGRLSKKKIEKKSATQQKACQTKIFTLGLYFGKQNVEFRNDFDDHGVRVNKVGWWISKPLVGQQGSDPFPHNRSTGLSHQLRGVRGGPRGRGPW